MIVLCATDDGCAFLLLLFFSCFFVSLAYICFDRSFFFLRVFGLRLRTRDVIRRCLSVFLCHVLLPFHICASRIRSSSLVSDKQTPYLCRVNRIFEYCTLPCSMPIYPLHSPSSSFLFFFYFFFIFVHLACGFVCEHVLRRITIKYC